MRTLGIAIVMALLAVEPASSAIIVRKPEPAEFAAPRSIEARINSGNSLNPQATTETQELHIEALGAGNSRDVSIVSGVPVQIDLVDDGGGATTFSASGVTTDPVRRLTDGNALLIELQASFMSTVSANLVFTNGTGESYNLGLLTTSGPNGNESILITGDSFEFSNSRLSGTVTYTVPAGNPMGVFGDDLQLRTSLVTVVSNTPEPSFGLAVAGFGVLALMRRRGK